MEHLCKFAELFLYTTLSVPKFSSIGLFRYKKYLQYCEKNGTVTVGFDCHGGNRKLGDFVETNLCGYGRTKVIGMKRDYLGIPPTVPHSFICNRVCGCGSGSAEPVTKTQISNNNNSCLSC